MTPFAQYATSLQRASYTTTLEHVVRKAAEHYGKPVPTGCWFEEAAQNDGEYASILNAAAEAWNRLKVKGLPCPSSPASQTASDFSTASSRATPGR